MHNEQDLIDRVAREMTNAEPSGDLRVRVIARLPVSRRQPMWHYAAVACSGLAVGMLIMVSVGSRDQQRPTSTTGPVASKAPVASGRTTNGVTPISAGRQSPIRPGLGPMEAIGPLGPVGPQEGAFQILSITPIQPTELSIAPIVVGPLVLSPVSGGGRK